MNVFYFYEIEHKPKAIKLKAYVEEDNGLSYKHIEYLRIYLYQDTFQIVSFEHSYGKDECLYSYAKSKKDLIESESKEGLEIIDRKNYERFRRLALAWYHQAGIIDFDTLQTLKQ